MAKKTIKIDLDYIRPNSSFIHPLYSEGGELILEARSLLTREWIHDIKARFGKYVLYTDPNPRPVVPAYRMKIAYNNSRELMEEILHSDKLTRTALRSAEKIVEEIINDLSSAEADAIDLLKEIKTYEEYLYNHSVNVGVLSAFFAMKRGIFNRDEIKHLTLGAYLHDMGEIKIEKKLLDKEGELSIAEIEKIKRHPQLGYEILKNMESVNPVVLQTVLFHHEKFDNQGYYRLPYATLPEFPKVISVCDIYDALTSKRPYREAVSASFALQALVNSIDTHFDYDIISDFINRVGPLLNNTQSFYALNDFCELNTQELAMVTRFGVNDFLKPRVTIFFKFDRQGDQTSVSFYESPMEIDLQEDPCRKIAKIITNPGQITAIRQKLEKRYLLKYC